MANNITYPIPDGTVIGTLEFASGFHGEVTIDAQTSLAVVSSSSLVIVKTGKGWLSRVLVTTQGADGVELILYDNASAASGKIIGIVPANALRGEKIECQMPCANGIVVGGSSGNPSVTVAYT